MPARLTRDELRAAYDAQMRLERKDPLPAGVQIERDGPLQRTTGYAWGSFVEYRDLDGLEGHALDELIGRQVAFFAARGESCEWKVHAHDLPADLPQRLRAAGFGERVTTTIEVAQLADVPRTFAPPPGVLLREVRDRSDLERIVVLQDAVWGGGGAPLADDLSAELAASPAALAITVAESDGELVAAGWTRIPPGTSFASLWGGATLAHWRRRGIYHALVAHRASLAARRGASLLLVEAGDESRPILESLSFQPVATATRFVWQP